MTIQFDLDIAIQDSLMRIRREYERCEGKIYLSFSGGKDSTILAELIKMANLPTEIPFVFANTGIELDATLRFVNEYEWSNKVIIKPRKTFSKVISDYGVPALSKNKSGWLETHQRNIDNPLSTVTQRQLILGEVEKNGIPKGFGSANRLAIKHFHFIHPDLEYKISNKCCDYMKKKPFVDYQKENNMNGVFTGIRISEGGARSMSYKDKGCVMVRRQGGKDVVLSMPIIDWADEICQQFIKKYDVKLSDAYEVYGMKRTGCIGCPFNKELKSDLEILHKHEPNKYKAALFWMMDVYIDQGVRLQFDEGYMAKFEDRQMVNEIRRQEMIDKYKDRFNPEIRKKY